AQASRNSADAIERATLELSAVASQRDGLTAIDTVKKELAAQLKNAVEDHRKSFAHYADEQALLAVQVARRSPATVQAVADAADQARNASASATSWHRSMALANQAELTLQQAAADLGAKEQERRRDLSIGESLKELAEDQQLATRVIAEQATILEQTER